MAFTAYIYLWLTIDEMKYKRNIVAQIQNSTNSNWISWRMKKKKHIDRNRFKKKVKYWSKDLIMNKRFKKQKNKKLLRIYLINSSHLDTCKGLRNDQRPLRSKNKNLKKKNLDWWQNNMVIRKVLQNFNNYAFRTLAYVNHWNSVKTI